MWKHDGRAPPPSAVAKPSWRTNWRHHAKQVAKVLVVILVLSAAAVLIKMYVPITHYIACIKAWIHDHHTLGAVLLPLIIAGTLPLGFPCSLLEIVAGSLFGIGIGVVVSMVGKVSGTVLAFLVGRRMGKKRMTTYLNRKYPTFRAICDVLHGGDWKPLLVFQLSGLPVALKCYGLSITDVSFVRFVASSIVGGLPNSVMWSWIGRESDDLLSNSHDGPKAKARQTRKLVILIMGIVATIVALLVIGYYTRKHLRNLQEHTKVHAEKKSDSEISSTATEPTDAGTTSGSTKSLAAILPQAPTQVTEVEPLDKS